MLHGALLPLLVTAAHLLRGERAMYDSARQPIPSPAGVVALSPVVTLKGPVVHGFGRGSKQLGIPTANLPAEELEAVLRDVPAGVYCGWASVGASDRAYKMVMSIGWCVWRAAWLARAC